MLDYTVEAGCCSMRYVCVCVCVCVYGTWTVSGSPCSYTGPRTLSLFGKYWTSWVVRKL